MRITDPDLAKYYQEPRGVPKKELIRLQKAFFNIFKQYNPRLLEEWSDKPNRNKGAYAMYSMDVPKIIKKLPDKSTVLSQWSQGHFWLKTYINPNGITGKHDIGRTYTIKFSFKGDIRLYRCRTIDRDVEYAGCYCYGRTVAEAILRFQDAWLERIVPVFKLDR